MISIASSRTARTLCFGFSVANTATVLKRLAVTLRVNITTWWRLQIRDPREETLPAVGIVEFARGDALMRWWTRLTGASAKPLPEKARTRLEYLRQLLRARWCLPGQLHGR